MSKDFFRIFVDALLTDMECGGTFDGWLQEKHGSFVLWACVDLARVVSAFVVFTNRPVKLIGLCKAAPGPFRNI